MITKEQILNAEGDELSRLAGEMLQESSCPHCGGQGWYVGTEAVHGCDGTEEVCSRVCPVPSPCQVQCQCGGHVDPIPLTWPEAMKWRDWAVKECDPEIWDNAKANVCLHKTYCWVTDNFFADDASPSDYIKAACLCKLGESK